MKMIIKKLVTKVFLDIGVRLHKLEGTIAGLTIPKFATQPKNLKISRPRRIDNPQHIFLGDDISIGPGSLLKTVTQYPGSNKIAEKMGVSVQKFSPELIIGNRVSATGSLQISALKSIIIEDDVMFASNVFICDGLHGYTNVDLPYKFQPMFRISPIKIGEGCWIGQNVVIMPGVTIGEMSIIGANSVVTKNIPPKCIAIGSPAKAIKLWDENRRAWKSVESD